MAKARSARSGRTGKKAKAARKSKKSKKPARKVTRKPARKAQPAKKKAKKSKKTAKKTSRTAARKPARRKAAKPSRKTSKRRPAAKKAPNKKAPKKTQARKKAPARKAAARKVAPRDAAAAPRKAPNLERDRKRLADSEETSPSAPSTLDYDRHGSAARTGRAEMREARQEHTATSPALTGGDVDADWEDAYAVGDEAPGGDNPTPDQDRVDDIGKALGVQYNDNEELKGADKIQERDRHRWELDPASSDDYTDRGRDDD